jgi:electron transfer flavoprotein alpha subunit
MYRPAFGGNIIAKIVCDTSPVMATVRTKGDSAQLIFGVGVGAVSALDKISAAAEKAGAEVCASRGAVDKGLAPYTAQVGLTGRTVAPRVYVAFGISGAVHHLVGMSASGTVIAVNKDKNAPIFEYADYGVVADVNELF